MSKAKARKAKQARQLVKNAEKVTAQIEHLALERWELLRTEGPSGQTVAKQDELDALYARKRELRREVYRLRPELEGRPVIRSSRRAA